MAQLLEGSPCIDIGFADTTIGTDLEGTPRVLDGDADGNAVPDLGAYEFSSPLGDTDGDSVSDYHEYVADTDGTDPNDWFRIHVNDDDRIMFESSSSRLYTAFFK